MVKSRDEMLKTREVMMMDGRGFGSFMKKAEEGGRGGGGGRE